MNEDPEQAPAGKRKRKRKQTKRKAQRQPALRPGTPEVGSNGSEAAERHNLRGWLGELSTTVKAVGGVAAAIATIVGLIFLFFPDLRPDPTPDEGSATLSKPTAEQPVTFGQYLDRVEIPRDGFSAEELQRPGVLVGVQVTIKGYRGQALPLRWYLLDGPEIVDQQSKRHTLTADRNDAPAVWSFWVALPSGPGPFRVVVEIYPPNARPGRPDVIPLDDDTTEPFPSAPA